MMRKLNISGIVFLLGLLLFVVSSEKTNAQSLQWVNTGGGNMATGSTLYTDDDKIYDMKADAFGNLYTLGRSTQTSFMFNGHSTSIWGGTDAFLMKTRCDGSLAWVKLLGGRGGSYTNDYPTAITLDDQGSVYMTGEFFIYPVSFADSARIGDSILPVTTTSIYDQMILTKFDSGGALTWLRAYQAVAVGQTVAPYDIQFNKYDNNLYVLAVEAGNCVSGTDSSMAMYVLKYDKNGNLITSHKVIDNAPIGIIGKIGTDNSGNIYLAGTYYNPDTVVIHGGPVLPQAPISSRGFICKFDTAGHFKWVKHTSDRNEFSDLAINKSGNIIAVAGTGGRSGYPLIIDTFNLHNTRETGAGGFAVVFDSSGRITTANMLMGVDNGGRGMAVDINKNDEVSFGGDIGAHFYVDSTLLVAGVLYDAYYATISSTTGRFLQFGMIEGRGWYDGINAIASDAKNNLYLGGYFEDNLFVPGDTFATGLRGGLTDIFIGKYGVASCLCNDASASFTESHTGHSFTYNSTATNADSLFWIFGDGATQAGGATANHTYTTGTPHSVCLWAFNDCSKDSSCLVTTGMEGVSGLNVEVYPNPASSVLQVNNQSGKNCTLQLIDVGGKVILNSSIINGLNTIDISNYGSGIYFILLQQENNLLHYKLVVQH